MHRLTLIGRLTRDPEMRYSVSGRPVTNVNVAVNDGYFDMNNEYVERTIWARVTMWGKMAERANNSLKKGDLIYVEGKLQHDNGNPKVWNDSDGNPHATFEVNVSYYLKLAGSKLRETGEYNSTETGEEVAQEEEISL